MFILTKYAIYDTIQYNRIYVRSRLQEGYFYFEISPWCSLTVMPSKYAQGEESGGELGWKKRVNEWMEEGETSKKDGEKK